MQQPHQARGKLWLALLFAAGICLIGQGGQGVASSTTTKGATTSAHPTSLAIGLRTPALSPDGQYIAFGYQGDIWRVSSKGGVPTRLTVHPAYDSHPRWSPDGRQLLFTSKREGTPDVYVMAATGGAPRRLTYHSATDIGLDWSSDGRSILFESNRGNIRSLYTIPVTGGLPKRIVPHFWNLAHGGRLDPNGMGILFSEGMESLSYWWRKGYRGPNHGRIHVMGLYMKSRQLSKGPHSELWPMWGPQGKSYYFVSDEAGLPNLWQSTFDGKTRKAITSFRQGPVRWPAINRKGTHIVYERNFGIWLTSLSDGRSWQVPVTIDSDNPRPFEKWLTTQKVTEFHLSPDGKKLAFVMEGEIFVTDADAKTSIRRLTNTPWREQQVIWEKDSLHLTYTSERSQGYLLLRRSALANAPEEVLLRSRHMLLYPRRSPDGKHLVFLQGKNRWMLLKQGTKAPTLLIEAQIGGLLNEAPTWSPDSQWVMYQAYDNGRGSLWAKSIDPTKAAIRLTQTAAHSGDGAWSPDGKYVFFRSNKDGSDWFHKVGDNDLYAITLHRLKQQFKEDKLDKLFAPKPDKSKVPSGKAPSKGSDRPKPPGKRADGKAATGQKVVAPSPNKRPISPTPVRNAPTTRHVQPKSPKSKPTTTKTKQGKATKGKTKKPVKPVKIEATDLRHRVRQITNMKGDEAWPIPGPKGKQVLFFSNSMGRFQLYLAKHKRGRLSGARPIAKGLHWNGGWSSQGLQWHPKGNAAYLLHRGKITKLSLPKGTARPLSLRFSMQIDRQARFVQNFREVWVVLRDHFYDPKMNGQDWQALYHRFLPAIQGVQTKEDWRDLVNEMLGFLNASHLGAANAHAKSTYQTGMLGADLGTQGRFVILDKIYHRGPVYRAMPTLKDGIARLIAINGRHVSAQRNPYPLLQNQQGKRVTLTLSLPGKSATDPRITKKLKIRPFGLRQARQLRYLAWVEARKALVKKWSKGRVGYLHMPNMGRNALRSFIRDFETDVANKAAAIIDLRYNFGGNVHDTVLQYLSRRRYASWGLRGLQRWPEPSHAALPGPMAMLINEGSLSDAEMTANGFKALKLGTLIGEPTYRWLIFTYSGSLLGGGRYRIPEWGCYTRQGKDLEKIGVTPHIRIRNTLQDRIHNRDPQLKQAVTLMLKQAARK